MDHFRKGKSLYASTSNSFGTGESVTITPNSVSGLDTTDEIVLTFDRQVTGKIERILGTISGSNFVVSSDGRGYDNTTEQAHTSPTVEYIPNGADVNDQVDGILVEHNQDGTHKTDITQTLTNKTLTSPKINEDVAVTSTATELNVTDGCSPVEKVLNVQSKCRVWLSSIQQNMTDNTWTKILFVSESYDVGSDFDTTNSRFVAPVSGYYQVILNVSYDSVSIVPDKRYAAGIYVNESLYSVNTQVAAAAAQVSPCASDIVYVAAGQYIEGYARVLGAGGNTVDIFGDATVGNQFTYMSIHLSSI